MIILQDDRVVTQKVNWKSYYTFSLSIWEFFYGKIKTSTKESSFRRRPEYFSSREDEIHR